MYCMCCNVLHVLYVLPFCKYVDKCETTSYQSWYVNNTLNMLALYQTFFYISDYFDPNNNPREVFGKNRLVANDIQLVYESGELIGIYCVPLLLAVWWKVYKSVEWVIKHTASLINNWQPSTNWQYQGNHTRMHIYAHT